MIDKHTQHLLDVITSKIKDDSYKVIEIEEFLKSLKRHSVNEEKLMDMMKNLQKLNYIDIKYSDQQVYCLAVLPKARNVDFQFENKLPLKKLKRTMFLYIILSGMSAFLGTALAIYLFLR